MEHTFCTGLAKPSRVAETLLFRVTDGLGVDTRATEAAVAVVYTVVYNMLDGESCALKLEQVHISQSSDH